MKNAKRSRVSAGLLMYRLTNGKLEVLLAHPGGPFFKKKDLGSWTIPKGEAAAGEDLFERAQIEFEEETGTPATGSEWIELGWITQKGGKIVHGWAFEGDLPSDFVCRSNTFQMEWPPHSGKLVDFPEVDRVEFFELDRARLRIKPTQEPFLDRLVDKLNSRDA